MGQFLISTLFLIILYYSIRLVMAKYKFNKRVEDLFISYIINENKFCNEEINEYKIKEIAKRLGKYERRNIYKKLYSKNSENFINYLLVKIKEENKNNG